ncbi:hypothetical protein COJ96_02465 [Bacillus sp. AFS073361]|uniref:hypothetical protein n=1 Tax=Bacillus sp. AFS073361 TaxID=2033511 RepID=UPI000BF60E93|nr:hypothetical protein [Bacillus sp. AFS073361]PFP30847.1 hypothetical protein COJ96_02465 [Bacillus sp. AFS073361]
MNNNKRNFLLGLVFWFLAFFFGYTFKKEGGLMAIQPKKNNSFINNENEVTQRLKELDKQFAKKANKDTNVFAKKTYGTYESAAVLSAIGNQENPRPEVIGFHQTNEATKYEGRDSVAFYTSNKGTNPTVVVNSGIIQYSPLSVHVIGITVANFNKILPGMLIDTYHTPNRYTSIVDHIDVSTQTIFIKDGWYEVKEGGSKIAVIPPNGAGFDVNRITKIWGINNNVYLRKGESTEAGIAEEIGLFNEAGADLSGIDVVNFKAQSNFGIKVRKAKSAPSGFVYGYYAMDSGISFMSEATNEDQNFLRSEVKGDVHKGFLVHANGTQSKLRLKAAIFVNGNVKFSSESQRVFILNKTVEELFRIPSPKGKSGELIFLMNVGTATSIIRINNDDGSIVSGKGNPSFNLSPNSSAVLISDGNSWYQQNFNNTIVKSGTPNVAPQFIGQEYLDATNKKVYKAFGTSSTSDWVVLN